MTAETIARPVGKERIPYQGKIFEIVEQTMQIGDKERVFEFARRSPGVRLIIISPDRKILLTKEYRSEHRNWDFRLPGGKVFDSLGEYATSLENKDDILLQATAAAKKEALEETGLEVLDIEHFHTDACGATVIWDLFYFVVKKFTPHAKGQTLELGENIELKWASLDEASQIALGGQMQETRSAAILLRFLASLNGNKL